jgi:transcriptional regulator with XRE-family HTH domain
VYLLLSAAGGKDKDMYFNQVEFGKRIKEERNRLQMTQEDLAQELNIGYVHMNGIENGRKGCSIDLLLEIAEVLDVSTDYLLTGRLSGGTNTAKNKLKEIAARLNEIVGQLDA